jgi:predicted transcriptional regulator
VTRDEIAARVDELADAHSGPDFVAAVEALADELDQEERDALGAVLLERANIVESATRERLRAKGWLRRTLDPFERRPRR